MTRFQSCIKLAFVAVSLSVASVAEAAEPCDLGVLVPGETYSFPTYTEVKGEYTPSQTGPVKFLYSCNPLQLYSDASLSEESMVDGKHAFVEGSQMISYPELQAGHTYYLYSGMTMMGGTLKITEGTTQLEVIRVTPTLENGDTFSVSSNYTIDVAFNVPVKVGNTLVIAGENKMRVSSSVSNTYVVCDVASTIMDMYRKDMLKGGDVMTLRLVNVTDANDDDNVYGERGIVEIEFVMAEKPGELEMIVNADQQNVDNPFMSYYSVGDESGQITFKFDKPVLSDKAFAKITYGDTDNMDQGMYIETLDGIADGNSMVFDFCGKLRRPIDMLPLSTPDTQPSNLNILFGNIYTEDGQRVYTGRQSNPTGFSLSFKLSTLQYTISTDFTPGRGSKLEAGKEMEIWVMNGVYVHTSGISFDFTRNGEPANVIVPLSDVKVEPDPDVADDFIYTFTIPELNADDNTPVVVSFADVECADGLDHSKQLMAEFGYQTSGVESIGSEESGNVTVYNAAGICVLRNVERSAVEALPKGLYIVNGKKTIIK